MAGISWNVFAPNTKIKSTEFNENFDWLEGNLVPMNAGSLTDSAYDLGTGANKWNSVFANNLIAVNAVYFDTASSAAPDRIECTSHTMMFINDNSMTCKIVGGTTYTGRLTMATGKRLMLNDTDGCYLYCNNTNAISYVSPEHNFIVGSTTLLNISASGSKFYGSSGVLLLEVNQGGEISSSYGFFHDRGDPSAYDWTFGGGALTLDGAWHDLTLSSIIPTGTKTVLIRVTFTASAVSKILQFRKNGNSNNINSSYIFSIVSNVPISGEFIIPVDSNRVIEYLFSAAGVTDYNIVVAGWWK